MSHQTKSALTAGLGVASSRPGGLHRVLNQLDPVMGGVDVADFQGDVVVAGSRPASVKPSFS
jgi:hypothetical protein